MPTFFLHVHDDLDAPDEEGHSLADLSAAIALAKEGARGIAAEQVKKGSLNLSHHIDVANEAGETIAIVTFGDAIAVTG
jgi:hypothetical protein